jgi:hypothetical protein
MGFSESGTDFPKMGIWRRAVDLLLFIRVFSGKSSRLTEVPFWN